MLRCVIVSGLTGLTRQVLETALQAELTEHLG
jgi:transposase-like protein